MPPVLGGAFWRTLENTVPPLIDPSSGESFLCPVKGDGMVGDLDYWGPGKTISRLGDAEPVASDTMGASPNHQEDGCNLLRKSADVMRLSQADWADLDGVLGGVNARPIP